MQENLSLCRVSFQNGRQGKPVSLSSCLTHGALHAAQNELCSLKLPPRAHISKVMRGKEPQPEHAASSRGHTVHLNLLPPACRVFSLNLCIYFVPEQSQAQRSSSIAMAGAIMGAVLALFLITVFIIVILTARKAPSPAFTDKV